MTYEIFLMRVMHRTGLTDRTTADDLTHHVVKNLAYCLPEQLSEEIAQALPAPLDGTLRSHVAINACDLDALYHSVAERLDVDVSFGLEFTQVACQVFGEAVGPAGRQTLQAALDPAWHPLFEPRQAAISPPRPRHDDRRTLSSAEPGSSRPISESQPGHRNSIARSSRPQFGTKLSTSHGKPEHRTLAGGRPGSSRPISQGNNARGE